MLAPNEIVKNERGAEVCHRVKKVAIEKVKGDPRQGHVYVDAYCNTPVLLSISEGGKTCPSCEKAPPVGNVHPRITNAAGVKLTVQELKECGITGEDPALKPQPAVAENQEEAQAVEAPVVVKKDEVVLNIPLKDLEGDVDVAALLIKKVIEGFGTLPTSNYAESKRIMKLEEKLEALMRS